MFGHAIKHFWPRIHFGHIVATRRSLSTRYQFYAEPAKIVILTTFWPPRQSIAIAGGKEPKDHKNDASVAKNQASVAKIKECVASADGWPKIRRDQNA